MRLRRIRAETTPSQAQLDIYAQTSLDMSVTPYGSHALVEFTTMLNEKKRYTIPTEQARRLAAVAIEYGMNGDLPSGDDTTRLIAVTTYR